MGDYEGKSAAWRPLYHPVFRALWIAAIFSNIGTWMQSMGGVWLMTTLTSSPLLIALMQTATTLPVFLVVLPAGALADIVDRRRMLLVTQGWMFCAAAGLSTLTYLTQISPWVLLAFTFALGLGSAMNMPAWQVVLPSLVPVEDLPAAVSLNSVSINISRAVGPALAGAVVAYAGPAAVFSLNALSFLGVLLVVYRWKKPERKSELPPEHVMGAIRAGTRYMMNSPELRAVLIRSTLFVVFSSALWALVPVVARQELGMGSTGFGALLGCIGGGGLIGALLMQRLRQTFTVDGLLKLGSLVFAASTFALAYVRNVAILHPLMIAAGCAWIMVMVSLNVATQTSSPSWVRARAMGFYALSFQGGFALTSALWGTLSSYTNTPTALICSAVGLCLLPLVVGQWKLSSDPTKRDLSPAHWAEPHAALVNEPDAGPIMIILEYRIDVNQAPAFAEAMHVLGGVRRRDGAMRWRLYRDLTHPGRYLELFVLESWAEHLRQGLRMTVEDQIIRDKAFSFHIGGGKPKVSHLIYEPNSKND